MANSLFDSAVESDTRVLLTGLWGDECLGTSFLHYADLIRAFQWRRLWSEFRANPDRADAFRPASLFRSTIWPLVPAPARQAIKNVLGRDGVAPWIDRRFAARVDLPARERPAGSPVKFSTMAKTDGWVSMTNGLSIHAVEAESRATAGFGLETRHPYGDRRILEFGYAIPDDQRWRPPYTKYVLRRAARGWLPDLVRDRLDFAGASSVVVRNVERQVSAGLWQNASIVRRGWVALPVLHAVYEKMMSQYRASDEAYERLALRLWFVCAVEIFMRYVVEERHD
jgi:asparagine synthase (glutamine-hydrolysing)